MTPLRLIPLLVATCVALSFTSTAGANTVTIATGNNKTFNPTIVNIAPGDTVEWNWVGPDTNHSPASNESVIEPFDTDPGNPNPNFNHPRGVNLSHTFQHSGSFAFHCKVHPDIMRGTVNVSGSPVPAFTSSSPAFVNEDVTFDGSTSNDPDGSIAKFEWDFGSGFAEATQTEHHTFLSTGTFTVKLRVTDDRGNIREVSHPITIASRAPSASFTVGPNPAAKNQTVNLDATASAPTAGRSIATYEWDLDPTVPGFEATTTTPQTTTSFASAGTKPIGLRVTDNVGDFTDATPGSVTISTVAPVASFTASNASPAFGGTVDFNGAGSNDPDGTIANFKWDLDGDGTFETDTGTTATTSHAYSTSGAVSVKLQVTDNEGGTNVATVAITVGSAPSTSPPPSSSPPPSNPAPPAAGPAPAPPAGPAGPAVAAVVKPAVTTPTAPKPAAKKKKAKKCPKGKKRNKKGKCVKAKKKAKKK